MAEKILIVDDDPETLRLIKLMLSRQGYIILTAQSGLETIDKLKQELPDLIVLDVMMPDMDGYQVTRQVRSDPDLSETPILMFSAKGQVDDKIAGYDAGADEYLTKPIHPAELIARIKALLARSRSRPSEADVKKGRVIGVLAPKGGLGVSTFVLNSAIAMRKHQKKEVIAVEMRPGHGTWCLELGLPQNKGLNNLLKTQPGKIDANLIRNELIRTKYGVPLLTTSNNFTDLDLAGASAQMSIILDLLPTISQFILLDIGANILPNLDSVLAFCNEVVVITEPQPYTVERTKSLLKELNNHSFGRAKNLQLALINRVRADLQLTAQQIETDLGIPIAQVISPIPEMAYNAALNKVPLTIMQPDGLVAQQFKTMAELMVEHLEA